MAARYHPDKHQDNELRDLAEEKLAELNEAYNVLSDATKRAIYDRDRMQTPPPQYEREPVSEPSMTLPIGKILSLLGIILLFFFGFRFLRSPRINALLGLLLLLFWFGPRIIRRLRGSK